MLKLHIENILVREEKIMAEWISKKLGEITLFITKGIPPKYVEEENQNTVRVLNQKCNRNFEISYDESRIHNAEIKKVPEDKLLRCGDVLINSTGTGTAGRVAQLFNVSVPTTIDGHMILLRPTEEINSIYYGYAIKTYTDEALELMRDNCTELRDLAIIDMLALTGMRVGEMVLLNRDDIDFNERECVVFGKGSKERVVYFEARTKIHLHNYLESRTDDNSALFVSLKSPHERLKIGGVEVRLREFGKQLGLQKVHPHKFRRTLATMAIDKGMPIEQLQQLLGHRKIDTTLQYAMVKQSNVKIAHRKYIG